jgi:hypothetical protein
VTSGYRAFIESSPRTSVDTGEPNVGTLPSLRCGANIVVSQGRYVFFFPPRGVVKIKADGKWSEAVNKLHFLCN